MKVGNFKIFPIYYGGATALDRIDTAIVGIKFVDNNGQEISVYINRGLPEFITIQGDDRLEVMPWATNMIRVRHSKE